ncbi:hypothetical protein [Kozakia baliensis]|uniref:hypothetical protein n=1 Tax=Kozakia baliensis TaxID=153496 RepID=UPI00087CB2E5|nr:hypothetical protein [Kozakia baliensis]AOX20898.1 hypothetical protein A0U90_12095 [Kozakia baliensis]
MNFSDFLAEIPARYELFIALLVIACKVVTIFVRPPAATSKWAPVFQIVSIIALNIGWATNRLQVGKTGLMVPRAQADQARSVVHQAGISVGSKSDAAAKKTP